MSLDVSLIAAGDSQRVFSHSKTVQLLKNPLAVAGGYDGRLSNDTELRMIRVLHLLLVAVYIALPAVVLVRGMFLCVRRGKRAELRRFWLACFGGMLASLVVCAVYALGMRGRMVSSQVLLTTWFATAMLLLLKGFDRLLWRIATWLLRPGPGQSAGWSLTLRAGGALLFRALVLFGIGLPYVLATVMTYRPRVALRDTPQTLFKWSYESVTFPATDNTTIAAWWIPATRGASAPGASAPGASAPGASAQTVLLCPGLSADKATQLHLVRRLVPGGYNVLALDLRAHGESGGQLASFGVLERHDVLGAVRWLRNNHPDACRKLVGVGASTGGAALLEAAADSGPEGQYIDAVAVYTSFDRLDSVARDICQTYVPRPLGWLVEHVGMPLASVQAGVDLRRFAPADAARQLWPRPLLVIHGFGDEIIRFERGELLYEAAFQPKDSFWIERAGHEDTMTSDGAARRVKRFFDEAARLL